MGPPPPIISVPGKTPPVAAETALDALFAAPPPPIAAALAAAAPPAAAGILAAAKEQRTAAQTKKQAPIWSNSRAPTAATRDVSGARRRAEALSEATNRIDLRGESNAAALRLFLVERGLGGYWPRIERLLLDEATDTLDDVNAARVLNFLQSTAASDGRQRPAEPMVPRWVHAGAAARGAARPVAISGGDALWDELRAAVAGARAPPLVSQAKSRPFIAGAHRTDDGRAAPYHAPDGRSNLISVEKQPAPPRAAALDRRMREDELRPIVAYRRAVESLAFVSVAPTGKRRAACGSAVLYDACHLLTSHSMIAAAGGAVTVTLHGDLVEKAEVVAFDTATDLAVLRIPEVKLKPVRWATAGGEKAPAKWRWAAARARGLTSPRALAVRQRVVAVSNAFGPECTLTSAVVASLDREEHGGRGRPGGSSGGPLLDADGRLFGITTALYAPAGAAGLAFIVPADVVRRVAVELIQHGNVWWPPDAGTVPLKARLEEVLEVKASEGGDFVIG